MQVSNLFCVFLLPIYIQFGYADEFWRRRWHSSVIARDWLYIDGGQISSTQGVYVAQNSTIGIDLSKDWTKASLALTYTARPSGMYGWDSQALWFDDGRNKIFRFGGDNNGIEYQVLSDSIQGFAPDGKGSGEWTQVLGPGGIKPFPSDIHSTSSGMFTSDDNSAYYVGGFISKTTSPRASNEFANSGLLELNFEQITLTNSSSIVGAQSYRGDLIDVPIYGSNGVLIAVGVGDLTGGNGFESVVVFDKKERRWFSQTTEGDIPRPRPLFCAVGVRGSKNTSFEIIIHGGIVDLLMGPDGQKSDEVYVLSLPAFRWFRANYTSLSPRMAHTCHATKTRQMILVGGTNPLYSSDYNANGDRGGEPQDPWDQGIGVFDMTALEFKDSYQSNTDPYEPPSAIQQFYDNSLSRYPSSWTSPEVQALFQDQPVQTILSTIATTTSSAAPVSPTTTFSPDLGPQQSRSHLGLGALIGIIMGCVIAGFSSGVIIMYLMKRRRKEKLERIEISGMGVVTPHVPPYTRKFLELSTQREPIEIMNEHRDRTELSDAWTRPAVELYSH